MRPRQGFTLLTVLWLIVSLSIVIGAIGIETQRTFALLQQTRARAAARWLAEGCLERLQSIGNSTLAADPPRAGLMWRSLDQLIRDSTQTTLRGCTLSATTDGRILFDRASPDEVLKLPGVTSEVLGVVLDLRARGIPITDLLQLRASLSPAAGLEFDRHYAELLQYVTTEPDAWVIRVRGTTPSSHTTAVNVEARTVRAGTRMAIVRWVEW